MNRAILESICANLLTTVLLICLSLCAYVIGTIVARRRYHTVFGLSNAKPTVRIFVSALDVRAGTTAGAEPLHKGFTGLAIQRAELLGARELESLLVSAPIPFRFKPLDYLLGQLFFSFKRIGATIDAGHRGLALDLTSPLVLVGTRIYNHVTHALVREPDSDPVQLHEQAFDPFFVYTKNLAGERTFMRNPKKTSNIKLIAPIEAGREPDREQTDQLAIVERHWDVAGSRAIILICGVGSLATASALRFVAEQHSACCRFQERHGRAPNNNWAILLKAERQPDDLPGGTSYDQIPRVTVQRLVTDRMEHDCSGVHYRLDDALDQAAALLHGATQ